jgi:hypothetical protein
MVSTSPSDQEEGDQSQPRPIWWLVISVIEWHIIFTIHGLLFAFLFPAVNRAREMRGRALVLPGLDALFGQFESQSRLLMFFLLFAGGVPSIITLLLVAVRGGLPPGIRAYFPLSPVCRKRRVTSDIRTMIVVTAIAVVLTFLFLIYLASHED